jgi:hypothetical protein
MIMILLVLKHTLKRAYKLTDRYRQLKQV